MDNNIKNIISDLIETSAPVREQHFLNLPYFHGKPNIYPALVLKDYILVTQSKRTEGPFSGRTNPHTELRQARPSADG